MERALPIQGYGLVGKESPGLAGWNLVSGLGGVRWGAQVYFRDV
jgi:hypothetical protein